MKIRTLVSTLLFAVAAASSTQAADKPDTPLGEQMEKMNTAFRKLGRGAVADAAKNADSIAAIAEIKVAATEALKFEPKTAADKPAAERPKFVADYQTKMKEFIGELDKLAALLKANKNEEAATLFASIGALQKADHKEFRAAPKKQ